VAYSRPFDVAPPRMTDGVNDSTRAYTTLRSEVDRITFRLMAVHDLQFVFEDSLASVRDRLEAIGWHQAASCLETDPDGLTSLDLLIEAPTLPAALEWTLQRLTVDAELQPLSTTVFDDRFSSDEMLASRPHRQADSISIGEAPQA
jgi:hypothetical protein